MISVLNKLKPKRLYPNKYAIIYNDMMAYDFGNTLIIYPGSVGVKTSKSIVIPIKDLYAGDIDNGIECDPPKLPNKFDELKWNDITINAVDLSILSTVSGIGEDTFILGKFIYGNSNLSINVYDFTHKIEYTIIKSSDIYVDAYFDWNIFYYLFQMFKHLSGKKTDTLKICSDSNFVYLSNANFDYYIIAIQNDPKIRYKKGIIDAIDKIYTNKNNSITSSNKKNYENIDVLTKTLIRPFSSDFNIENYTNYTKFYDSNYSVYLNNIQRNSNG